MRHNLPGTFTAYIIAPPIDWETTFPKLLWTARCHRVQRELHRVRDRDVRAHTNDFGFFKFRHPVRGGEAVHTLRKHHHEPATLRELVGCLRPKRDESKNLAVLAGGTIIHDRATGRRIPCFHKHGGQRSLLLDFYDAIFDPCWHFLVRLPPASAS